MKRKTDELLSASKLQKLIAELRVHAEILPADYNYAESVAKYWRAGYLTGLRIIEASIHRVKK